MASANYSHAEGIKTKATGQASHAEGSNTTASKVGAHAEGYYSTASGDYSHSEGYYTIASKSYQHAQGKYNVEDTGNKYAHIFGNGSAGNKRSNAHTVDWSGNAWFAGDVYIGGTSQDDAVKLENITIDETLSDTSTNPVQNKVIKAALDTLSSSGVVVDSTLSTESTNPVQNKVITSKVNEITESLETIKNKPAVQPDWNQNDESAADYIKNRTHYVIDSGFEITWDGDMTGRDTIDVSLIGFSGTLVKVSDLILSSEQFIGASMKKSDGTEQVLEQSNLSILPNAAVCEFNATIVSIESVANTSAAFGGLPIPSTGTYFNTNSGVYVNYFKSEPKLQKIDRKFLPDSLPGMIVSGKEYTLEDGTTVIAGPNAEVFNNYTINIASGDVSHAEGNRTIASGDCSHAEGTDTIAFSNNQHVQGKYNIEDTNNRYAHIVGNGDFDVKSNAHTLDWNGNAWFAGKVYVGGTSQDDAVELTNVTVDDVLSDTSTNPVQYKVITTSLNAHINDFNIHVTNEEKEAWNNKSEFSGSYNDLTNKPTDLASTSYVDNKVAELVNSAPEALNTLDELAEALGNDENFATTITNALAGKASQNDLYTHINNTDVHITAEEKALIANIDNLATKEYVDKDSVIFNLNKLIEDKEWGTKDSALGNTIIPFINYLNTNQINLENGISVLFKTSEQVSTEEGSRNVWQR